MIINNMPLSLSVWLLSDDYDRDNRPNVISATSIIKSTKSLIMSMRATPCEESKDIDLMSIVPSRMGTAIHAAIEAAWKSNKLPDILTKLGYPSSVINRIKVNPKELVEGDIPIYMEQRSEKQVNGFIITGKFDFVVDGTLEDFKSTGVFTYTTQTSADKYILQGSIYRWLNPDLITSDHMYIRYIFTDWSATKAKQDKDYPPARLISQKYQLMSLQETENYVISKIREIIKYIDMTEYDIPPCTSADLWQRPDVYKYYKNPTKKVRSTANFATYYEAYQRYIDDGSVGEVVTVPGEVVFCKYCNGKDICKQASNYRAQGILNDQ